MKKSKKKLPAARRAKGARPARAPHSGHALRTGGRPMPAKRTATAVREYEVDAVFRGTSRGYGFAELAVPDREAPGEDVFIPAAHVRGAIDGDRIRLRYHGYDSRRDGGARRLEGEVVSITQAVRRALVGTLCSERVWFGRRSGRMWYVRPDDSHLPASITLPDGGGGCEGEKVEVTLDRRGRDGAHGHVSRIFGAADDRGANYEAILASCEIPTAFPPAVLEEAAARAAQPLSDEGRTRHTGEVIFTIDGAGAKDLDDAISLRLLPGGRYLLGVHIADVSEYVTAGSEADREAMRRGTSVYFVDKVVPMLPEALSNGACSLNAGEDKYALSAYMTLGPDGAILSTRLSRGIIRSRVRGVYSEVNDLLANGKESPYYPKYRAVYQTLLKMKGLYELLAARSRARGAIDFDRAEAEILLDAAGEPCDILLRERGVAERMIEQFMLAANEGVAREMTKRGFPCVYRVHARPEETRLADFILYAHNLGLDTRPLTAGEPSCAAFSAVLAEAEKKGLKDAVSYAMLRTMAKAEYSETPAGHFGLGIELYCHFTSPIRRLSDLATHRIVKAVLLDGERPVRYAAYAKQAAAAASESELRALDAERQIEALYKTLYMARHVGEEWDARISSVASFGIFAELANTCEGLIPIAELGADCIFEEKSLRLRCGEELFCIGDPIRIRIEEADIATHKMRFSLVWGTRVSDAAQKDRPAGGPQATPKGSKRERPAPTRHAEGRPRSSTQKSKKSAPSHKKGKGGKKQGGRSGKPKGRRA